MGVASVIAAAPVLTPVRADAAAPSWHDYEQIPNGPVALSEPAVAVEPGLTPREKYLHVVVQGPNHQLWSTTRGPNGDWSGWLNLGGPIASAPAIAATGYASLHVVASGTDGAVWERESTIDAGGGAVTSGPALAVRPNGGLELVARDMRNGLAHRFQPRSDGWHDWDLLGGSLVYGPAVAAQANDQVAVVAVGTDGHLWLKEWRPQRFHAGPARPRRPGPTTSLASPPTRRTIPCA